MKIPEFLHFNGKKWHPYAYEALFGALMALSVLVHQKVIPYEHKFAIDTLKSLHAVGLESDAIKLLFNPGFQNAYVREIIDRIQ